MMQSSTAGIADMREPFLSAEALAFAKSRRISEQTLARLGVDSGMVFFPDACRQLEALIFRYGDHWKARSIEGKFHVAGKGLKLAFWNLERVLGSTLTCVYITEGELDACALVESGIPDDQVLSVPNGAVERTEDSNAGLAYVAEGLEAGLNKAKRFVWCGDEDGPGHSLRAQMVRVLGAARFHFVKWPDGCKDANDLLRHDGGVAVRELVTDGCLPWPVDGLYRLSELPEPPPLTLWHPGFPEWESKVMLAPRTLSVATGHPNHGKTLFFGQVFYQIIRRYGLRAMVASFETRAKPHLRRQLRTLYCGRLEKHLRDEETAAADAWINDHYLFAEHPDRRPTLQWFLDLAEVAVIRHGARIVQIDPWNRLLASRARDETETDYIGRCLREIHDFAHDLNCHVQILAHPAKTDSALRGQAPTLEDIAGSKHWDNMVDQGFAVHRPQIFDGGQRKTEAIILHRKARFEELGYQCKLTMNYDLSTGRYVSVPHGGH